MRKLPENEADLLNGRHEAGGIAESLHTAYWLHSRDPRASIFHLNKVHDNFAALADQLGYDITERLPADSGATTESNEAAE
jgi:hypothetical protein